MRAEDLRELVQDAKNKNPKIKIIQMGSWLNQYKPFRSLFPKTWRSTMKTKKKIVSLGGDNLLDQMEILITFCLNNLKKN